ncbi:MAG: ATP-binding protein, partial [Pseudomonadota bacterium]
RDFAGIVVTDNGIGIPEHEREHIFRAFVRLTDRSGDGLGLAVVRRYVHRLGGSVTACANADGHTEFRVRLPMAGGVIDADHHDRR